MLGVDLVSVTESLKELPDKTEEMLQHLTNIENLLADIAKNIEKLVSE